MEISFSHVPLLNQASVPKTWGIWRYAPGGIITEAEYIYETETIGPYKFHERYGWVQSFYIEQAIPPTYLLYKYMLQSKTALVCMFVNNWYICVISPDSMAYHNLRKPGKVDVFTFEKSPFGNTKYLDVGWVKMKPKCYNICHLPYRLQMDTSTFKVFTREWVRLPSVAQIQTGIDFGMYKELLDSDKTACYRDMNTHEVVLI